MFEAKLLDGSILKKIVEAIRDVVTEVNIDINSSGTLYFTILQILTQRESLAFVLSLEEYTVEILAHFIFSPQL